MKGRRHGLFIFILHPFAFILHPLPRQGPPWELGVGVLRVAGVLGRLGAEGQRVGSEFVIGGAIRQGFDEPKGGCAGLGGDFPDERDADGGRAVAESTPGWSEGVAEDEKK